MHKISKYIFAIVERSSKYVCDSKVLILLLTNRKILRSTQAISWPGTICSISPYESTCETNTRYRSFSNVSWWWTKNVLLKKISKFLFIAVQNTYGIFNQHLYRQMDGSVTANVPSPTLANIFMTEWEKFSCITVPKIIPPYFVDGTLTILL